MASDVPEPTFEEACRQLRDSPAFRVILRELRLQFADRVRQMGDADEKEAHALAKLVSFQADQYLVLAGEEITA